eukprot:CAMPEP_0194511270 /NCGR_PEP_ID=MMETSP0253-20130528/42884_1 /TAXON_ID=2966 /ORGANISM="Noctiluca scintillans" /LENGTH=39 /DNA_ID= /DNA_START= /DNA_END= /DNA_ORIENTATION=
MAAQPSSNKCPSAEMSGPAKEVQRSKRHAEVASRCPSRT